MRVSTLRIGMFLVVIAAAIGAAAFAEGQQAPPKTPQNLQVLPKNLTLQQVQQQMRTFAAALGVECAHCHVGTLAERSKDDNPKKGIARKMILMTNQINADLLKGVGDAPAAGVSKVTCYTCHRGAIKPLNAPGGGGH